MVSRFGGYGADEGQTAKVTERIIGVFGVTPGKAVLGILLEVSAGEGA